MAGRVFIMVAMTVAVVAVAGCRSTTWVRPGATPEQLDADRDLCTIESFRSIPQVIVAEVEPGYSDPGVTTCVERRGKGLVCTTEGAWESDPLVSTYDLNEDLRGRYVAACLRGRGWTEVTMDGKPVRPGG